MTTKKIKGIIVGAGRAGVHLHYGALKVNGVDIIALVDIRRQHVQIESKRLNIAHYYTSLNEALKKHDVDFVSICTDINSHLEMAVLSLKKGCHVLIEKPMTTSVNEADILAGIVEKTKKTVCVVHNHKFYPSIQKARKIIESGEIGEIIHIHREMTFVRESLRMMEKGHWAHDIKGGRMFEANPHNIYLLYNFIGKFDLLNIYPRKVYNKWPHAKIDEFLASFSNKKSTISLKSSLHAERKNGYKFFIPFFFLIVGTKGSLIVTYSNVELLNNMINSRNIYKLLPLLLARSFKARLKKFPKIYDAKGNNINIGVGSGHYYYMKEYVNFLRGKKEIPVSWDEAYFTEVMNEEMGSIVEKIINDTQTK